MLVQLCRDMIETPVNYLVPGRLFGVRRQAVVFQGIAGQAGNVLNGEVHHRVLRYRGMAVPQHPSFVEVGGLLLADLLGYLVERLRPPRSHRKGNGDLLLSQFVSVQRIDAPFVPLAC